jgi:hypothetical protein
MPRQHIWTDDRTLILLQVLDQNKCKPESWIEDRKRIAETAVDAVKATFAKNEPAANDKQVLSKYVKIWSKYRRPGLKLTKDFWQLGSDALDVEKFPASLRALIEVRYRALVGYSLTRPGLSKFRRLRLQRCYTGAHIRF